MMARMSTPGALARPRTSMIAPSGLTWRRGPVRQFHDDLVADLCAVGGLGVIVAEETRVVGNDVMEIMRLLERADNGVGGAFEDADQRPAGLELGRGDGVSHWRRTRTLSRACDAGVLLAM